MQSCPTILHNTKVSQRYAENCHFGHILVSQQLPVLVLVTSSGQQWNWQGSCQCSSETTWGAYLVSETSCVVFLKWNFYELSVLWGISKKNVLVTNRNVCLMSQCHEKWKFEFLPAFLIHESILLLAPSKLSGSMNLDNEDRWPCWENKG